MGRIPTSGGVREGINPPLIQALASRFDFPDMDLVRDMALGVPIAGEAPECGALAPRPESTTLKNWRDTMIERNNRIVDRVKNATDRGVVAKCWPTAVSGAEKGRSTAPAPLTRAIIETRPLTPRFATEEQHGSQGEKCA